MHRVRVSVSVQPGAVNFSGIAPPNTSDNYLCYRLIKSN